MSAHQGGGDGSWDHSSHSHTNGGREWRGGGGGGGRRGAESASFPVRRIVHSHTAPWCRVSTAAPGLRGVPSSPSSLSLCVPGRAGDDCTRFGRKSGCGSGGHGGRGVSRGGGGGRWHHAEGSGRPHHDHTRATHRRRRREKEGIASRRRLARVRALSLSLLLFLSGLFCVLFVSLSLVGGDQPESPGSVLSLADAGLLVRLGAIHHRAHAKSAQRETLHCRWRAPELWPTSASVY